MQRGTEAAFGALAALPLAAADPTATREAESGLRRFLHDEATATLHLLSYHLDRTDPSPPPVRGLCAARHGRDVSYFSGYARARMHLGVLCSTPDPELGYGDIT